LLVGRIKQTADGKQGRGKFRVREKRSKTKNRGWWCEVGSICRNCQLIAGVPAVDGKAGGGGKRQKVPWPKGGRPETDKKLVRGVTVAR